VIIRSCRARIGVLQGVESALWETLQQWAADRLPLGMMDGFGSAHSQHLVPIA
jgi:hypothetical protein